MSAVGMSFVAIGGVIWTIATFSMGAPVLFTLFGIMFVCFAVVGAIYHHKNATSKNRFSSFDIVDESEETDPFNEMMGNNSNHNAPTASSTDSNYCPYCGVKADEGFEFCNKCGKKLP